MTTTRPDRRSLLLASGTGFASLAVPGWISAAFARQGGDSRETAHANNSPTTSAERALGPALERAAAIGKPLMAIVVPDEDLRLERGRLWGDLFAYAPEAAMADFALCEWVCASAADLVRSLPELKAKVARETVAVLIETDGTPPRTRLVAFRLGDLVAGEDGGFPTRQMKERSQELARLLQAVILPEPNAWNRRREQSERSRAPGEDDLALLLEEGVRLRLGTVDRCAAIVRAEAERFPTRRARYTAALAEAAALRLWDAEPAGAAWKTEHVDPCPPCGMAMLNGASRAFLEFYTAAKR